MSLQFGPEYVRAMAPYVAGKPISEVAREFGLDASRIVKLASNENPLGMPASAKAAMAVAIDELARYPDANGFSLKAALHAKFGVPEAWITLGNGSNDILELAARALVAPGQGVIYIANPNNPTGTFLSADAIAAFLAQVPPAVVVVLDEAYNEFLAPAQQYDSVAWVRRYPNLLVSRTFSKAYGLAGLRVGYGIAQPQLADLLNRIRQPFNVNSLAQAAAVAALNDVEFLRRSAALNAAGYAQLTQAFERLGLEYVPSSGNFVLVRVGDDAGAGACVNLALLKQGVIVRPVANYGLPQWLRISIGLPEENAACIAALESALAQAKAVA